jgi:hypothetical protein
MTSPGRSSRPGKTATHRSSWSRATGCDRVRCEIEGIGAVENPIVEWTDDRA